MQDAKGNELKVGGKIYIHGIIKEMRDDGTVFIKTSHGDMFVSVKPENVVSAPTVVSTDISTPDPDPDPIAVTSDSASSPIETKGKGKMK